MAFRLPAWIGAFPRWVQGLGRTSTVASHRRFVAVYVLAGAFAPVVLLILADWAIHTQTGTVFAWSNLLVPMVAGMTASLGLMSLASTRHIQMQLLVANRELERAVAREKMERTACAELLAGARAHELGQLVAVGAVHDFRNLMSTVKLVGDLLSEEQGVDSDISSILNETAIHGTQLCERVLSTYTGQHFSPKLQSAAHVLAVAVDKLRGLNGGELKVSVSVHGGPLYCDEFDLFQILHNLVENSLRAGSRDTQLHVSGRYEGIRYVLRVRDNGPGFPALTLQSLEKASHGTHGFGLQVVQALVERNDGSLQLANHADGAEVTLAFPTVEPLLPRVVESDSDGRYSDLAQDEDSLLPSGVVLVRKTPPSSSPKESPHTHDSRCAYDELWLGD